MAVVLLLFFGIPLLVVIAVSFFDFDGTNIVPTFILDNYTELFTSEVTLRLYLKFDQVRGDRLGDHAGDRLHRRLLPGVPRAQPAAGRSALFLLCTVPFWTSNIIRMISWIPFLGRNGIFNQALMGAGIDRTSRSNSCCSRISR